MFYSLKETLLISACLSTRKVLMRHARRFFVVGMFLSLLSVGLLNQAQASDGFVLDSSFSQDGKQITAFDSVARAHAVILQPDGKIVAAGERNNSVTFLDFVLVRYNSDGSLDPTFGQGGRVTTDFGDTSHRASDSAYAVALQSDGKIVAAGVTLGAEGRHFALARYNSDGQLDPTFGDGGKIITNFGSDFGEIIYAVAIQADGKIVAAGMGGEASHNDDFALARYNSDGSLDPTFDGDGKVTTDFFNSSDTARGIVLQAGGRIVVAGSATKSDQGDRDFALARYNPNGSLDQAFGNGGKVITEFFGGDDDANAITLQTDGKMVVAGITRPSNLESRFALVRYNRNGSLDPTFGNGGKVTTDFGTASASATAVAFQPIGGKIIAAGAATNLHASFQYDFAVARYNSNGSLDGSFADGGKATTEFFCDDDAASAVAVQPDGKIVAAGYSTTSYGPAFTLARYTARRVVSPEPKLLSVTLALSTTPGCKSLVGAVTLGTPAPPGGLVVTLSDNIPAASLPSSVFVPAGETTACFSVSTSPVSHAQAGSIVAMLNGMSRSTTLIVRPIAANLDFSPNPVTGPNDVTGILRLECPAPAGGLTVQLSSRNPGVAHPLPTSIFIPEGQDIVNFGIRTADVPSPRSAVITATVNGISRSAVLIVE